MTSPDTPGDGAPLVSASPTAAIAAVGALPGAAAPAPAPPPQVPTAVIEQYKAKLTDLGNLGTRQTSMTTYYVSILSALFGVLAFKDRKLPEIDPTVIIVICAGGILVSMLWFAGINFFRSLFRAKLQVLEKIEKELPFQTFDAEFKSMQANGSRSWLRLERFVPLVFVALFAFVLYARFSGK
jgi:Na+/H+-dicarboxylate symporter